ncbi:ABC transporter ATP-binding protein [Sporosarcina pasteurii]|uniref:Probable multidrug resistance ABC transporter ATP-binding/permease protein YheH n=1 Tax=Sporosarcina pasteurii TaxID=1474 RepID=A0A380BRE8_SPOPA|nr:ABC transporter transmembrane domain-containing protein [Sporosarcina pasteurii]MDS9471150.1 ABC transporter transmembrane domain-containing protein [Sporosarcina pasteurii]QBQ05210.1 ATP-binding cassette domain-containing protein [Sporosarcina pasteurii]SUJ05246.1 Probable multidrug resistance ABC transporter ATP-binding/permease protein YheH [Sporosarcina pasteurii]
MNSEKQPKLTANDQWVVLKRLLRYTTPHKGSIAIALILLTLTITGTIIGPLIIQRFIDNNLIPMNFPKQEVMVIAATYIGIQLFIVIVSYFQLIRFQDIALKIIQQMRIDVFSKVQGLGMTYFDQTPVGSIVSRVTNDTESIKDMFVSVIVTFLQAIFVLIGVYIALFSLDVKLTFISLLLLPLFLLIVSVYRHYSADFYQDIRERLSQLNAKIAESLSGMGMIQAFRQEERLELEFDDINEKHYRAGMRNIKFDGILLSPAIELLYTGAIIFTLGYFGFLSLETSVEVGVLYAFTTLLGRLFQPVQQVMQRLSIFQQALVSASRVFKLMDDTNMEPEQKVVQNIKVGEGKIEFRNVSFSYDGQTDILKNISFTANAGETVALVGHTGSGKSSIINLLMRFYEFERGEILVDGVSLKEYPPDELREKMGLVLQDPFMFYGDIASNIRLHNQEMPEEKVRGAAEFVSANEFIEKLPDKYSQRVTERGATFSSGQRQLIAFARTMATNPKILVLDEATANIDTETEIAIQASLEKMRKGRTTIAIAHRLSTIQDAELILVLHKGEIVERGTHQELLAQKGLYYMMYELQNSSAENAG